MRFLSKTIFAITLWIPVFTFDPSQSQAEIPVRQALNSIGGLAGGSWIDSHTFFTFGAEGTYTFLPPFAAGLSVTYYNQRLGPESNRSYTTFTAQGLAFLYEKWVYFHGGIQLGLGLESTKIQTFPSSTSARFILGPTVGADIILFHQVSFGFESTLYFNATELNSLTYQLLGSLKFWI